MGVEMVGIMLVRGSSGSWVYCIKAVHSCAYVSNRLVMKIMCGQKLVCFPIKFQEFTFVPLDNSKGVSHHWDCIRAYCGHGVVCSELGL
eukprot:15338827-Ditylum_brightwellii.AAC.2